MNKRKLVLEALLALSLTTLLSTVVYAEKHINQKEIL